MANFALSALLRKDERGGTTVAHRLGLTSAASEDEARGWFARKLEEDDKGFSIVSIIALEAELK